MYLLSNKELAYILTKIGSTDVELENYGDDLKKCNVSKTIKISIELDFECEVEAYEDQANPNIHTSKIALHINDGEPVEIGSDQYDAIRKKIEKSLNIY